MKVVQDIHMVMEARKAVVYLSLELATTDFPNFSLLPISHETQALLKI